MIMKTDTPLILIESDEVTNQPVELYSMQEWLMPYIDRIVILFWVIWIGVLVYLVWCYIIRPLMSTNK